MTAVNATTSTFITVYPGDSTQPAPNASDLNVSPTFRRHRTCVVVRRWETDGTINLFNAVGNVNLIVDVSRLLQLSQRIFEEVK